MITIKSTRRFSILFSVLFLTGLLTLTNGHAADPSNDRDPFERGNRAVLNFNFTADRYVLKPVAKTYARLPNPVRRGVGNFFSNLWEPTTVLNDLLQGKFAHAGRDTGRFVINSTFGLFGLVDVASQLNMPRRDEDFGQTLAVWGVPAGPYLVLPFLGPSNLRDAFGAIPEYVTDPLNALESPEREYASGLEVVDRRASLLGADDVLDRQADRYLFLREGYWQQRALLIHDGNPPGGADGETSLQDELLENDS